MQCVSLTRTKDWFHLSLVRYMALLRLVLHDVIILFYIGYTYNIGSILNVVINERLECKIRKLCGL